MSVSELCKSAASMSSALRRELCEDGLSSPVVVRTLNRDRMRFSEVGLPNHGHESEDTISVDGIDRYAQKRGNSKFSSGAEPRVCKKKSA